MSETKILLNMQFIQQMTKMMQTQSKYKEEAICLIGPESRSVIQRYSDSWPRDFAKANSTANVSKIIYLYIYIYI